MNQNQFITLPVNMATEKDVFTILIDHNTETDKDISKVYTPISVYMLLGL